MAAAADIPVGRNLVMVKSPASCVAILIVWTTAACGGAPGNTSDRGIARVVISDKTFDVSNVQLEFDTGEGGYFRIDGDDAANPGKDCLPGLSGGLALYGDVPATVTSLADLSGRTFPSSSPATAMMRTCASSARMDSWELIPGPCASSRSKAARSRSAFRGRSPYTTEREENRRRRLLPPVPAPPTPRNSRQRLSRACFQAEIVWRARAALMSSGHGADCRSLVSKQTSVAFWVAQCVFESTSNMRNS